MEHNMITPAEYAKAKATYRNSRFNLLLLIAFTFVNIIMLLTGTDLYFLFSATVPYYLVVFGLFLTGHLPDIIPEEEPLSDSFLIVMILLAAVILLLYLLFYFLSKKHPVLLIVALVFFAVDCLYLMYTIIGSDFSAQNIIDILFHIWVMVYLISGVIASRKLKLPVKPETSSVGPENPTDS